MKKILIVILLISLLTACGSQDSDVVKIGIILPLTGSNANLGEGARLAAEMAFAEYGEKNLEYELIFEDDALKAAETSIVLSKLINIDNVDAVISFSSGSGNIVTPVAQENKIIHFGIASDANVATGEYNFIHATPPEAEAEKWIEEAVEKRITKIAILTFQQQGVLAITDNLEREAIRNGIEIAGKEFFNVGDKDVRTQLLKLKETNPDIIFVMALSPELENIGRQHKELGIKIPTSAIETLDFTEDPNLFEGSWYVSGAEPTDLHRNTFIEKYGKTPTLGSANTYDIIQLIMYAYEKAEVGSKPSKEKVLEELHNIKGFQGVLGTLDMNSDGIVVSPASLKEIRNGEIVVLS